MKECESERVRECESVRALESVRVRECESVKSVRK